MVTEGAGRKAGGEAVQNLYLVVVVVVIIDHHHVGGTEYAHVTTRARTTRTTRTVTVKFLRDTLQLCSSSQNLSSLNFTAHDCFPNLNIVILNRAASLWPQDSIVLLQSGDYKQGSVTHVRCQGRTQTRRLFHLRVVGYY